MKKSTKKPIKKSTLESIIATIIFAAIVLPLCAVAQVASSPDFVKEAAVGGMFEVQSSQIALSKSQNDDVRKFAQMMISDHTKIGEELKASLPGGKNPSTDLNKIVLPTSLDEPHQDMLVVLSSISANDFDQLYIKDQVNGHMEAVKLFQSYSKFGDEASLQSFASKNLPIIEGHLDAIKKLQSQLHQ